MEEPFARVAQTVKASSTPLLRKRNLPRFDLAVRPGVFEDGTFGIYAVPRQNPRVEYQLDGRFPSIESALIAGAKYLELGGARFESKNVRVGNKRATAWLKIGEAEEYHSRAVQAEFKRWMPEMALPTKLIPFLFGKIGNGTPYLLCTLALLVYWRSWVLTVPKEGIPFLSDLAGGTTIGRHEVALFLPALVFFVSAWLQIRERLRLFKNARMRSHILALVFEHRWGIKKFFDLFTKTADEAGFGWLLTLGEQLAKKSKGDVLSREMIRKFLLIPSESELETSAEAWKLFEGEFELRVHALYFMQEEAKFEPWKVWIPPLAFILQHERLKNRMKAFAKRGHEGYLLYPLEWLPGWENWQLMNVLMPAVQFPTFALISSALVLSIGFTSSSLVRSLQFLFAAGAIGPILFWNLRIAARAWGRPRAMSLLEATGDPPVVKAL